MMRVYRTSGAILALLAVAPAPGGALAVAPAPGGALPGARAVLLPSADWGAVTRDFVHDGGVDYAALGARPAALDRFLAALADADPAGLSTAGKEAFWINAYNAVTLRFVLDHYPGIASVRDVPGFFDRHRRRVAGRPRSLDEIEEEARSLGDPRVHFALVCASSSCPDLRDEAYRGAEIERQLDDQMHRFLADPQKGLRYDEAAGVLRLSKIFEWYAGDFTGGSGLVAFFARGGVRRWVVDHLADRTLAERLRRAAPPIEYLDYDWHLNDRPGSARRPGGAVPAQPR